MSAAIQSTIQVTKQKASTRISENSISETIATFLDQGGKFQWILIFLLSLNSITVGINHTVTAFHTYLPAFFCRNNLNKTCDVTVNGTECPDGYSFDEADAKSIVVEWSLVCRNHWLGPLVNTTYFIGVTLGALICSTLCDVWGRKKLVIMCLYTQALMSLGQYFSNTLEMFMLFRLLQGFFIQGLQTCSYTLMLEFCPSKFRTMAATVWEINWAIGLAILSGASYFIRDWRILTLVLIIPTLLSVSYAWVFPESITWLYAKKNEKKAIKLLKRIATYNGNYDVVQNCNSIDLNELAKLKDERNANTCEKKPSLSDIVRNSVLRKHLFSMIDIWFSVTLSYYGILYFLPNLAGERHLNFLLGAGVEAAAYILGYFVLSRYGRRMPMALYQYTNAVLLILIGLITIIPEETPLKKWCLVVIALTAKGFTVSCFCSMFIYCSELFPTVCRGLGLGLCGFAARCGSLLAPQLMQLVFYMPECIALWIMAGLLLFAATVTLFLPETLSSTLPNTIAEADEMWMKKK